MQIHYCDRNLCFVNDKYVYTPVQERTQEFFMGGGSKIFISSDNGKLKYTIYMNIGVLIFKKHFFLLNNEFHKKIKMRKK
jgi:hypothetical protein